MPSAYESFYAKNPNWPTFADAQSQDYYNNNLNNSQNKPNETKWYDYSQPQNPNESGYPGNVAPMKVASDRSYFDMPNPNQGYSIQDLVGQYFQNVPNYVGTTQGPGYQAPNLAYQGLNISPYTTNAMNTMSNLGYADFGIPQQVQEQMKVQAAQQVSSGIKAQREAAKRQLASMGLLNDSASYNMDQQLLGQQAEQIGKQYSDINTQSALKANDQYLQNLSNLMSGGNQLTGMDLQNKQSNLNALLNMLQLNEQGRQFNVTGSLDQNKLQNTIGKWIEETQQNRTNILGSLANFLENMELERKKQASGIISEGAKSALYDQANMANLLKTPDLSAFNTG